MSAFNFNQLIRRIEQLGADTQVTYYALVLGAQDTNTGQYSQGYNSSNINMLILQHAPVFVTLPSGVNSQNMATGYTVTEVFEGDRIEDSNSLDYVVTEVIQHGVGDVNVFYECELALLFPYTQSSADYTWPAPPSTGGLSLNVGAVTWDACVISCILNRSDTNTNDAEICTLSCILNGTELNTNDAEVCTITTILSTGVA